MYKISNSLLTYAWLLGVVLVCGSQAVALPLVKRLEDKFNAAQLLIARGKYTALIAISIMAVTMFRWPFAQADSGLLGTLAVMATFGIAALSLYKAIQAWDVSLTITVVAATPIVNFAIALMRGKPVSRLAVIALCFLLVGVALAVRLHRGAKAGNKTGILWALLGVLMNGLYYEALAWTQTEAHLELDFWTRFLQALPLLTWQAIAVWLVGWITLRHEGARATVVTNNHSRLQLLGWALLAGFLYFLGNILAFQNVNRQVASVLLQLETPAVIAATPLLVPASKREHLTRWQWLGIVIAVASGFALAYVAKH